MYTYKLARPWCYGLHIHTCPATLQWKNMTLICIYIHTYIRIQIYMYICAYVCIYTLPPSHTAMEKDDTHLCIHIYVYKHIHMYIYTYICKYTPPPGDAAMEKDDTHLCICIYTYICIHTCIHIYIYIYTYVYMYIYTPARRCCYERRRHSLVLLTQDSRGSTSVPLDPACTSIMWGTACLLKGDVEIVTVCMYVCTRRAWVFVFVCICSCIFCYTYTQSVAGSSMYEYNVGDSLFIECIYTQTQSVSVCMYVYI